MDLEAKSKRPLSLGSSNDTLAAPGCWFLQADQAQMYPLADRCGTGAGCVNAGNPVPAGMPFRRIKRSRMGQEIRASRRSQIKSVYEKWGISTHVTE